MILGSVCRVWPETSPDDDAPSIIFYSPNMNINFRKCNVFDKKMNILVRICIMFTAFWC